MINIWLDDLRPSPNGFTWVKNIDELIILFIKCESDGDTINIISLDHDLGDDIETGYEFVKWLIEEWNYGSSMFPKHIYLHTANPVGRENMYQLLIRYKPETVKVHKGPMPNND